MERYQLKQQLKKKKNSLFFSGHITTGRFPSLELSTIAAIAVATTGWWWWWWWDFWSRFVSFTRLSAGAAAAVIRLTDRPWRYGKSSIKSAWCEPLQHGNAAYLAPLAVTMTNACHLSRAVCYQVCGKTQHVKSVCDSSSSSNNNNNTNFLYTVRESIGRLVAASRTEFVMIIDGFFFFFFVPFCIHHRLCALCFFLAFETGRVKVRTVAVVVQKIEIKKDDRDPSASEILVASSSSLSSSFSSLHFYKNFFNSRSMYSTLYAGAAVPKWMCSSLATPTTITFTFLFFF